MKIKLDLLREGDVIRLEPTTITSRIRGVEEWNNALILFARGEESVADYYHRLQNLRTGRITELHKNTIVFWYAFDQITNPPLPLTR